MDQPEWWDDDDDEDPREDEAFAAAIRAGLATAEVPRAVIMAILAGEEEPSEAEAESNEDDDLAG